MKILLFICYVLFTTGVLILSGSGPSSVEEDLKRMTSGEATLRNRVREARGRRRTFGGILLRARAAYDGEHGEGAFVRMCFASIAAAGLLSGGAVCFGAAYLLPVVLSGCAAIPVFLSQRAMISYDRKLAAELETALSVISSAYIRCGNLVEAVKSNLPGLRRPVSDIFKKFVVNSTMLSSNAVLCIRELQRSTPNPLFREWCDVLIACADDFDNSSSLLPVVDRMTEERLVNSELETMTAGCRREYFGMVIITLLNIPLLYVINRDWFHALVGTPAGKAVLAFTGCAVFATFLVMTRLTRPVDASRLRRKK